MDYSYDEFNALVMEVQKQSGARLEEECDGVEVAYTIKDKPAPSMTCHCSNPSLFAVPYDGGQRPDKPKQADPGGLVRLCAVCDAMGSMPRFEKELA